MAMSSLNLHLVIVNQGTLKYHYKGPNNEITNEEIPNLRVQPVYL